MDVGTVMSAVQTLLAALQCSQLRDFCSSFDCKPKLEQLEKTVKRIQAVLIDAELKQALSHQEQLYIEELKEAVFEADDLFDEFVTLAAQKKLNTRIKDRFFALFTKLADDFSVSKKIDKIRKKLDDIADNSKFKLKIDLKPANSRSRETCSYMKEVIIGRDQDLETIKGMLPNSDDVQQDVFFISIVGIGGLGKTALARLLFNDPTVATSFPLRLWACVADQDQNQFEVRDILGTILESGGLQKQNQGDTLELMQRKLRDIFGGQRYLLVLDDVWTEDREQWLGLLGSFTGGGRGSCIVVTTRSMKTAKIIGNGQMHQLQGLSMENSLRLFKWAAFGSEESSPPQKLVEIGEEIVKRCAHVPLAIRVLGGLLYGQDESQWLSLRELGLEKIIESDNSIKPILKLSYYQLESPLKSCFAYCALFPKDEILYTCNLISLWMAQGYITSEGGKSMEDVAVDYVKLLIQRCFFQDVRLYGDSENIREFKMHDLMHDVAQEVVGKEIQTTVHSMDGDLDKKIRHLKRSNSTNVFRTQKSQLRSYVDVRYRIEYNNKMDQVCAASMFGNWKCLRALDLSRSSIKSLPGSIGKLLHLRYLDLSENNFKVLPRAITNLYNLQTLQLFFCKQLKELPKDIDKLVQLRVLNISRCDGLTYMPRGITKLTDLRELGMFVVGGERCTSWKELLNEMKILKPLRNLRGSLQIRIKYSNKATRVYKKEKDCERDCLSDKEHLECLDVKFSGEEGEGRVNYDEAVMDMLRPHCNLKELFVEAYQGASMVGWAMEENLTTSLPNLVYLGLWNCLKLSDLRCLGNICHLKVLFLCNLENLEYIIEKYISGGSNDTRAVHVKSGQQFFPSLRRLRIQDNPKLKGWVGDANELHVNSNSMSPLVFSQLEDLYIVNCPKLIAVFHFPLLKFLYLSRFNRRLQIIIRRLKNEELEEDKGKETCNPKFSSSPYFRCDRISNLREIEIDDTTWLNHGLHMEASDV
ncbi:putative disease resistance protein RGA4 [Amaranthus tricolor]|uniref:putative disease resistance protein RGA4 n=1 Tax=Amaranthus tricolor TaxID=29722 RepID=UPI0025865572|nr:putative disease resistance protein RGA4 [Amaranthus tricolor]